MHKKISVVIPVLNEESYIEYVLQDLSKQTYRLHEIIVVDGGSEDKTVAIIKKQKKITLLQTKKNIALQRNAGANRATGEILFFLDADVRLNKNFVKNCITFFDVMKAEIACPLYFPSQSTLAISAVYLFFNILFFLGQFFTPSGAGSCIMLKKSVFMKGKGFIPKYRFEDIEMIRRYAKQFRFRIVLQPVYVSDRRFQKEGFWKTTQKYLFLSYFFITNNFEKANDIGYQFGEYNKK